MLNMEETMLNMEDKTGKLEHLKTDKFKTVIE